MTWISVLMLALAGFLLGGMITIWRTSRPLAGVLAIGAALAIAAGIAWLL